MTLSTERRTNLARFLRPRSIAFIGGAEAQEALLQTRKLGFAGQTWVVNPKRAELGGVKCFPQVQDLPEAPDACFLAVSNRPTIQIVSDLARMGAGGVVCYAAGFREMGDEGTDLERQLIAAAGDMALVGPNCYGVLNYLMGVALWPFSQPSGRVNRGAALITQSGMFAINLTFSQRSTPFSYVISAGNQSVLAIEDYIGVLLDDDSVPAIGLHIEMLRDVPQFARVALRAARKGVPIVAFKTGTSQLGSKLTVSHTGSLAGSDDAYNSLFERLGVTRVDTPAQLLETLKMFSYGGKPEGMRLAAFTCSGGDAEMVADWAEHFGLSLPQPGPEIRQQLLSQLGPFASVSNPLDYNTAIWGKEESVTAAHATFLRQGFDVALLIQDFPPLSSDVPRASYLADTRGFLTATQGVNIPAIVCSTMPEALTEDVRNVVIEKSGAPLQGIRDGLYAISAAAKYGARRKFLTDGKRSTRDFELLDVQPEYPSTRTHVLGEYDGKKFIARSGINIPTGRLYTEAEALSNAHKIEYPVAVKLVSDAVPHKTEAGAVKLNIRDPQSLATAISEIKASVTRFLGSPCGDSFLLERMIGTPVAEMMIGIRRDPQFGLMLTVGAGGTQVEIMRDVVALLLPIVREDLLSAISKLRIAPIINGFRGQPPGDLEAYCDAIMMLADFAQANLATLHELEINPVMVLKRGDGIVAVDALVRISEEGKG